MNSGESNYIYKQEISKINKRLSELLRGKQPSSLYLPCSYILEGEGKRLRPFLVLISAKAVGGDFKSVANAALAVEILHNFTLVHDDIMDNSNKRRGRPTLHNIYDLSTAILAGDNLIALAYKSLLKDCRNNSAEVLSIFTQSVIEVCEGQSLDKEFEVRKIVSIDEYKVMIYKKTAALAEMCCTVGALIAGANKEELKIVRNYGKYLGMAFQIQDDLLDLIAEEAEFGKSIGIDLIEGKKTYLLLLALQKAKGKDKKDLLSLIDRKGILPSEIEKYKNLFIKLGVIEDAEQAIIKYTKLALKNLSSLPNEDGKYLMNWLANVLTRRNK